MTLCIFELHLATWQRTLFVLGSLESAQCSGPPISDRPNRAFFAVVLWLKRYERKSIENQRLELGGSVTGKFSRSTESPPRTIFARIDRPVNVLQLCR